MKKHGREIFYYVNFGVFFGAVFILGLAFVFKPKEIVSTDEKRKLAAFPQWDLDSVAKGVYMKRVDEYIKDHFPFRDAFISHAFAMEELRGWKNEELIVFDAPVKPKKNIKKDKSNAAIGADTAMLVEEVIEDNRGLVISNGRAMQLFGGNNSRAKNYAAMVNTYYNALKDEGVNVFNVVVPSAAEFYLPQPKYKHLKEQEKRNISMIYENEAEGIKKVDAYSKIAAHKDEYVYFRTDHHWTGLGAYYAYTAFCETAGFDPVPLDKMVKKAQNKFFGSLYFYLNRNSTLAEHYDTVHYWKLPDNPACVVYRKDNMNKAIKSHVIVDAAGGYSVFLGADYPLIKMENGPKNGKSIVVIKNSYGNPFITYLVSHYEKVYSIDFRYYNGGIIDFIRENKVTDLLFINGSISANTPYTSSRIKHLMYSKNKPKTTKDKDTTASKTVKDTLK
ncbi:MAG TPA: DHHW family protein [Flavobacteriales bacterium]|nr:DHHW family protein [Flavobacteriales bacterium]